ncbi:MAG TPA: FtsX-like permease family protein [Bacteroides sp.]|nr:FtsX-like permease family protein [Bacteroides sp.]
MFSNIIKVAFRNLYRNFGYTFINVLGLAIGLACSILILLYVNNELTYDKFHEKAERTYRIGVRGQMPGNELNQAVTASPMMEALRSDYPEVEHITRVAKYGGWLCRTGDRIFQETAENFKFADSTFFDVFNFELLRGDPKSVLQAPRSLVMSERYANKYFGNEDPIGKTLRIEQDTNFYTVTGLMKNVPVNSHFHFEMLGSMCTIGESRSTNWLNHNYYTYVVLREGADVEQFTVGLNEMVIKYVGPMIEQFIGITLEGFTEAGNSFGYFTQPLLDIHLHSNLQEEIEPNGNPFYVYIFLIIAFLILIIACINFMNLATARATTRSREVGIRKVVGSRRSLLITQFLTESVFLSLIAMAIGIVLVYLLLPGYRNMIRLDLDFNILENSLTIPGLILFAVFVGILSGSYPAFVLASYKPVSVFKPEVNAGSSKSLLRSILVVLQFSMAIVILMGTFFVNRQLSFMQNKDLGFEKNNVLVIHRSDALKEKIDAFKQDLKQNANILEVANSRHIPSMSGWNNVHWLEGMDLSNTILLMTTYVSHGYGDVLNLELQEGRFHSREMSTDTFGIVINQAAVKSLGLEDPLNTRFIEPGETPEDTRYFPIIGVVKDFHYESMHEDIKPMAIHFMPGNWEGYIMVRMGGGNIPATVDFVQQTWDEFNTDFPFEYSWLDDEYGKLFEPEKRTGQILSVFSILAIFISCLGLFGLISYSTSQRTKEIGIRKTMGASILVVVRLLSKETVSLLAIASVVSFPAYFVVKGWLQNFAFHVQFNVGLYLVILFGISLFVLLIAILTVSYQTYKAAAANPAESLRVE